MRIPQTSAWTPRAARLRALMSGAVDLNGPEPVELESHAAAWQDGYRCGDPTREDELPGLEGFSLGGQLVRQPGDRRSGVTHDGGAGRGHRYFTVHPDDASDEVEFQFFRSSR